MFLHLSITVLFHFVTVMPIPKLTKTSKAVKLLHKKFLKKEVTLHENSRIVWDTAHLFVAHKLDHFWTIFNQIKAGIWSRNVSFPNHCHFPNYHTTPSYRNLTFWYFWWDRYSNKSTLDAPCSMDDDDVSRTRPRQDLFVNEDGDIEEVPAVWALPTFTPLYIVSG